MVNFPSSKNNTPLAASVVGYDPLYDLAVLKVAAKSLPYAKLGDSSKLEVGDIAIAIGNPSGEQFSGVVTTGVISALNKQIERTENGDNVNYKVLQTDARIYTGNIGGALCDANGNVIGINSFSNSDGALGNAVPINDVNTIVNSIIKTGHVIRPDIGFTSRDYYDKSKKITGVIVKSVLAGSGASNAGIKIGDIVTQLDTIPIKSIDEIGDILEAHKVGDSVPCVIYRNGKYLNISIVLSGKADDN
jgi:serine protease Do